MRVTRLALLGALISVWAGPVHAAVLRVPADHGSIQEGVVAAAVGDTVLVAPGEYTELIMMKGGVVLKSEAGPDSTVLLSPGLGESPKDERLLEVQEDADRSTVIEGFTLDHAGTMGTAIHVEGGSPTIRGNVFRGFGWGIHLRHSKALITDNLLDEITTFGILIFASSPEVYRNTIRNCNLRAIDVSGRKSHPVIGGSSENGNHIHGNNISLMNSSRNDIDATWNDWGWDTALEMERKGYPADITDIIDGNDRAASHRGRGKVDSRNWVVPDTSGDAASGGGKGLVIVGVALAGLALGAVLSARRRRKAG